MKYSSSLASLLIICFLLTFQSCHKDTAAVQVTQNVQPITIAEARRHFDEQYGFTKPAFHTNLLSRKKDTTGQRQPKWDAALLRTLKSGRSAVLVPIHKPGAYVQVTKDKMAKFGFLNYLMMSKDSTGRIFTEWVELKPSENWISSAKARPFDGNILVKNWEGKLQKVFTYDNGVVLPVNTKRSANLGPRLVARTGGENPGDDDEEEPGDNDVCFVTQTLTITVYAPKPCPCKGHTYEQIDICDCSIKPQPGSTTYTLTVEIDCPEIPEDPPIGGGPGGSGGGGGGSGSSGEDYPPISCNPDPDYEVPTTPPPAGTEYAVPCDEMDLPVEDLPANWQTDYLPLTDRLIAYYNSQADPTVHIGTEEAYWMHTHASEVEELIQQMQDESENSVEFVRWSIRYLTQNEDLDFAIFRKLFLTQVSAEGMDGILDESLAEYWDDPNLIVQQQTLPSDSSFNATFPKHASILAMPAPEVYQLVGGQVYTMHQNNPTAYGNACALRVSRGLNYSGITIPNLPGQTYKGGDNKYYFLSAIQLLGWMKKTFPNFTKYTGAQGGSNGTNFNTLLKGKRGILILIPNYPAKFEASGHADYWQNMYCNGDCYFNLERIGGVNAVYFWQLN